MTTNPNNTKAARDIKAGQIIVVKGVTCPVTSVRKHRRYKGYLAVQYTGPDARTGQLDVKPGDPVTVYGVEAQSADEAETARLEAMEEIDRLAGLLPRHTRIEFLSTLITTLEAERDSEEAAS